MKLNKWLMICVGLLAMFPAKAINDGSRYAAHSVLSSGKWIQLKVTENAVYKLTYDEIKAMGFDDPAKVKLYGYGGWMLEEDFTKSYIDDLPEVPMWIDKGADGIFNSGDYLLFYGMGTLKWSYDASADFYTHTYNPYSTYGSYFLTENNSAPQTMSTQNSYVSASLTLTTFDDYVLHEKDSVAIMESGRELFGESFIGAIVQNFSFQMPGITADAGKVALSFAAMPTKTTPVSLSIGGKQLISISIDPPPANSDGYRKAYMAEDVKPWAQGAKNESFTATVTYNSAGQAIAMLNYITVVAKRNLRFYDKPFVFFRSKESRTSSVNYRISNAGAQTMIWDVTDGLSPKIVQTTTDNGTLSFNADKNSQLREYAMIDCSRSFPSPQVMGVVENQDLHALPATDLVIIVPKVYQAQAETLADKHRQKDQLRVITVQAEKIYNEFSSGCPDATAYRRFVKMFYDRATTEANKPKYLLLFGDGLFDNRHLTTTASTMDPQYYLMTYQFRESLNEATSYGTDDYFGFLDDNEGLAMASEQLDLGVGRFPVNSVRQATNAVNKVTKYMDDQLYTGWKNNVIFTADDTGADPYCVHATQADTISQFISTNAPEYVMTKSYMDAFKPVSLNGKKFYPDAKKKFLNALNEGACVLNYTGHGGTGGWSAEDMLNSGDVRQMNFEGLPLWITATCDFGWFDRFSTTGAEEAFLNEKSGAIALFTTSRVVYSNNNANLNGLLVRNLFSTTSGQRPRLGDVLRRAKNGRSGDANRLNYVLLGDPALMLAYPDWKVELEKINGSNVVSGQTYTFKALEKVTLQGKIVNQSGQVLTGFNGAVNTTVLDNQQAIKAVNPDGSGNYFSYIDYPNRAYFGTDIVTNGRFTVSFTVPLDISYSQEKGKICFYAFDENNNVDAVGSFGNYRLTGSGSSTSPGTPQILGLYLDNETFLDGDTVNEAPVFIAKIADTKGINMTGSGLGHDITLCIDRSAALTYTLNRYYFPDRNHENQGEVRFPVPALKAGAHQLEFKVWNIENNSALDSLHFQVVPGLRKPLYDLEASQVPARTYTDFTFSHSQPDAAIDLDVYIYDLAGHLIWNYAASGSSVALKAQPIRWNLSDNSGVGVQPGIYLYRAIVTTSEGKESSEDKKIIVIGQ
ncbi:MAG: type IX secretion system sortase PorU [Dysgonamonadaceae bacterium]|jgi:hypothetical protein|nr:type IX secretion system sortase PorU [Dysgonamonadaceae bacterium]